MSAAPPAGDRRLVKLTLDEAIHTSMERNLGIQLQEFQYREAGYGLRGAYGIYDVLGRALLQERSSQAPVTSTIEASSSVQHLIDLSVTQNTPTGGSWVNQVERWFAGITDKRIRRGSFTSVRNLETAIRDYLDHNNKNPKPFVWTADADLILGKIQRLSQRISNSGH